MKTYIFGTLYFGILAVRPAAIQSAAGAVSPRTKTPRKNILENVRTIVLLLPLCRGPSVVEIMQLLPWR